MKQRIGLVFDWILLGLNDFIILKEGLLGRTKKWEPFSKLYTGWIVTKNGNHIDWLPLLNLFLFSPMLFLLNDVFPQFFEKHRYAKAIIIAFLSSLLLESAQLISRLGTFQISDLVYNTISGIIGVVVYQMFEQVKNMICEKNSYSKTITYVKGKG